MIFSAVMKCCLRSILLFALLLAVDSVPVFAQPSAKAYVFPIMSPRLSSKFGKREHPIHKVIRKHHGLDLAVPLGTPVRVITGGRVVFAGPYAGYGKLVTIDHGDTLLSLYGHLDEILVNLGQMLEAGHVIGRVGSTGQSTGPHLHFEIRKGKKTLDPEVIFPGIDSEAEG
jgi:murein DD-endopeptidase MepM/ murein hydrolase activator NlpD